ncbi:MAG: MoxR-like ATPase [Myxococcaceae bacterium]|nr:MoxR-like ATPase [Myxococcaceae bacterium]
MAATSLGFSTNEAGRLVASVLLAAGPLPPALVEQANHGLVRLSLLPLAERDFVVSTPEELAPLMPAHLRGALADLLLALAGDEPLRRRMALAYLGLWNLRAPGTTPALASVAVAQNASPPVTERIARAMIGNLPRHQGVSIPEERAVYQQEVYRSTDIEARRAPPVVDPLRTRVARVRAEMLEVLAAVDRVVIGKHDVVSRVLTAMAARGHVLLVDAPGVGKTLLCKTIAAALGARFGRVQLTPDLMPMDVTGGTIYDAHSGKFVFRPGPVFTNVLLADEINRATPKTQSALLEVMEERTVTVDGVSHRMADPFQVLATMNPQDHDGTFPLPAAQIDRFMVMLELGYPSPDDEVRVLDTHLAGSAPSHDAVAPVISADAFVEWQRTVPMIHASPEVKRAAVGYVDGLRRTATNGNLVSPRATLAWMRAAQARAILAGREFVTVDDLLDMAPDVLRHRLWISAPEVRDRLRMLGAPAMGQAR